VTTSSFRFVATLALAASCVAPAVASTSQEQAVLAPVQALFAGMAQRNAEAIRAAALPGTPLLLMRDGKPSHLTIEEFAAHVAKPGKTSIEERIHDPLVRVDNDLAVVWAPFDFLADGKVDHCGTDLFSLVRIDGKWLIASVADTGTNSCKS
jgi:hypothetical protein